MSKQKLIFLESEGDAWFRRNKAGVDKRSMASDPLFGMLKRILSGATKETLASYRLLEIGCSNGNRLQNIRDYFGISVTGVDPSEEAVSEGQSKGLTVERGTADHLPFEDKSFDIVIFGFCLYLCDIDELFKISAEADRVLKGNSWLLINDFFSRGFVQKEYVHKAGITSNKMDYSKMFTWHPHYEVYHHELVDHEAFEFTDNAHEWMAITLIRKISGQPE